MYRIRTFNKISPVGLNRLDPALYAVSDSETDEDAILVRSAKLLDYDFPKNLLAISRAVPASTISPWTAAPRRASWYSTPPVPTPTP